MDSAASPVATSSRLQQIEALEAQYLFPTYARIPLLLERGKGPYVFDSAGKRYLDFITGIGVNAMGHSHAAVLAALREQAKKLIHTSNLYYNEYQGPLAQRLTAISGMERAFFTVSGTEAVEGALKIARSLGQRIAPDKIEIVALEHSFHGRTMGALSITGQLKYRAPFGPMLPGVRFVPGNDVAALTAAVNERTCAIAIEPVQGEGGVRLLSDEFLATAARLAREHRAALFYDEIQCGLGRTGRPFAYQWTDTLPDILTTAKPIAAGFPLGVILARGAAAVELSAGLHGTTFGGGPLACRLGLTFLDFLEAPGRMEHIQLLGAQLLDGLRQVARRHRFITEVRGRGLMAALQLDRPAKPFVSRMAEHGLLANVTHDTIIRFLPPFIVDERQVKQALRIVAKSLREVAKEPTPAA